MFKRLRRRRERNRDDPGAPPGYLLDLDDHRCPNSCAGPVDKERWDHDPDGELLLARGFGEKRD